MLLLQKVKFKGLRRFVEWQEIDFSILADISQLDGQNLNTGGSSGAGKSSVLMAIDYLFGVNSVPATNLQSNITKDSIEVVGEFLKDNVPVVVERSKKNGLKITYGDEVYSGSSNLCEEKLDEIIGVERSIFRKMYHKRQKEGGFFLDMTPKKIYEFLADVLNLNEWTSKVPLIEGEIKSLTLEIEKLSSTISAQNEGLRSTESLYQNLLTSEPVAPTGTEAQIVDIKNEISNLETKKALFTQKKKEIVKKVIEKTPVYVDETELKRIIKEIEEQKQLLLAETTEYNTKMSQMRSALTGLNNQLYDIDSQNKRVSVLESQLNSFKSELQHMREMKCPTCVQVWVGDTAKQKMQSLEASILSTEQTIQDIQKLVATRDSIVSNVDRLNLIIKSKENDHPNLKFSPILDSLSKQKNDEENKISNILRENDTKFKQMQADADIQYLQECSDLNNDIRELDEQIKELTAKLNHLEMQIREYNAKLNSYNTQKSSIFKSLQETKDRVKESEDKLGQLISKRDVAEESKRFIKSFVTKVFEESLESIGERATMILSNIPNMANASIYFETAKETKDGKIKEEVTGIINMDGENEFPINSLSGGERTSIDLAVDLAVIDLIESKVGKGINLFLLDEPFVGLDSVSCLSALELLKSIDSNKKIIIVDHNPEVKESISDKILVKRDGVSSEIVII